MDMAEKEEDIRTSRWPQFLAAFSATIGAVGLGCGLGWTSPVLPNLVECKNNPEKPEGCSFSREFTLNEGTWIGALYTVGALISSFVIGFLLTSIGRKPTILAMAVPFVSGWVILAATKPLNLSHPKWFYAGRLLTGFGATSTAVAVPIYVTEICDPSIRGSLGLLMPLMGVMGIVSVNGVGRLISWDKLTMLCVICPTLMFLLMLLMPESPLTLLAKGEELKARQSLQWLRGSGCDIEDEFETLKQIEKEQRIWGSFTFTDLVYLKPLLIMLTIHFIQQFCGINAIVFYLSDIFLKAGLDMNDSLSAAALVSCTQIAATSLSLFVTDRVGRRLLLILSSTGMMISLIALGTFFYLDVKSVGDATANDKQGSTSWLPLASLIAYRFAFSLGFGPLPWILNCEFFAREAKETSSAIVTAFNWCCAFAVSKFVKDIETGIGADGLYFLFAGVCALATGFVAFVVPETRGRSAEQMRDYFQKRDSQEHKEEENDTLIL